MRLDNLAEAYECELLEKHYEEERNNVSNTGKQSSTIDISKLE